VQNPQTRKIIKTKKGHTIQMEDADGEEMVTNVEAVNKHVVTMNKVGIKITDGANNHTIVLNKEGIKTTDGVNNHTIVLDGEGIKTTDGANNHAIVLDGEGIKVTDGVNNHEIILNGDGIKITDSSKNEITMGSEAFKITSKVPFSIDASGQPIEIIGATIDFNKG